MPASQITVYKSSSLLYFSPPSGPTATMIERLVIIKRQALRTNQLTAKNVIYLFIFWSGEGDGCIGNICVVYLYKRFKTDDKGFAKVKEEISPIIVTCS